MDGMAMPIARTKAGDRSVRENRRSLCDKVGDGHDIAGRCEPTSSVPCTDLRFYPIL